MPRKLSKKFPLILILIFLVVAGAIIVLSKFPRSKQEAVSSLPESYGEIVNYSPDVPDETPPGTNYQWKGGTKDPKLIRIPSVGVEGYIQKVGIDQKQQITVPANVHLAGWFVNSVRPGEKGLSIIDGHRNGIYTNGIFRELEKLKPGDSYEIEFGDSSVKKFKVMTVKTLTTAETASELFSQSPQVSNQLNLITCGGEYNSQARAYEQRVLVTSVLQT